MAFRKSKDDTREAMRWRRSIAERRGLFAHAGLPEACAAKHVFDYFLMHAALADGSGFTFDELRPDQRKALGQLVTAYLGEFDDPGVAPPIPLGEG